MGNFNIKSKFSNNIVEKLLIIILGLALGRFIVDVIIYKLQQISTN